MAVTIGPGSDTDIYEAPRPELLRRLTGLEPVAAGSHVMLGPRGVRSAQRLAVGVVGQKIAVALWPAELKEQALFLYGERRGVAMIEAALMRGWNVQASPHIAFRNAAPPLRLYMTPEI